MKKYIISAMSLMCGVLSTMNLQAYENTSNEGVYINFIGGANFLSFDKETQKNASVLPELKLDETKTGYLVGGAVGYKFSQVPVRVEGEYTYRNNNIFSGKITDDLGEKVKYNVKTVSHTFMGNAYYDIETGTRFTPYVGLGAGVSRADLRTNVHSKEISADAGVNGKTSFAMQAKAGVNYALCEKTEVGVEYSYLHNFKAKNMRNQGVSLNVRRYF